MKNFDLVSPHSKSSNDLLEHIHQSIAKEEVCEIDNNYVAASYAGLETWSYLKQLMGFLGVKDFCGLEGHTGYDLLY